MLKEKSVLLECEANLCRKVDLVGQICPPLVRE